MKSKRLRVVMRGLYLYLAMVFGDTSEEIHKRDHVFLIPSLQIQYQAFINLKLLI